MTTFDQNDRLRAGTLADHIRYVYRDRFGRLVETYIAAAWELLPFMASEKVDEDFLLYVRDATAWKQAHA